MGGEPDVVFFGTVTISLCSIAAEQARVPWRLPG